MFLDFIRLCDIRTLFIPYLLMEIIFRVEDLGAPYTYCPIYKPMLLCFAVGNAYDNTYSLVLSPTSDNDAVALMECMVQPMSGDNQNAN